MMIKTALLSSKTLRRLCFIDKSRLKIAGCVEWMCFEAQSIEYATYNVDSVMMHETGMIQKIREMNT